MILSLFEANPALAVAIVLGFVVGITIHEAAHAYSALRLGDDTAYRQGRVTLNPAAHLDVLGSLVLLMVGFGWGRPTPVDLRKLRGGMWGPVAVAFAGPLSNLILVAVCAVIYRLPGVQGEYLVGIVAGVAFVNALLFVFNLIPIPPLDGAKVLFPFLPRSMDGLVGFMNQYGPLILLGLILITIFVPGVSAFGFILSVVRPILALFGLPSL
ncbi:site-2 protease family protein [Rubrobacter taiwanensis]|jgi:Zn-dependent protease|uniref:Site-2 protease family protein n=1 Tax=Rubrobacter taiwanensis TaxID=185139 RepID=A0A4R1BG50_9ACTN|nr:site-2 protease family protein [Rubrobacter taiwanensis]TCJ16038.1 site-2 protease family protein [Rubrobacter taiwanensis]